MVKVDSSSLNEESVEAVEDLDGGLKLHIYSCANYYNNSILVHVYFNVSSLNLTYNILQIMRKRKE